MKNKNIDLGLLIIRLGIGIMFMIHGFPKIAGGPKMWEEIGGVMSIVGISFYPVFWGFMAAFAEFAGGLLLMLGVFFRPACGLLSITMIMATIMHAVKGDGFGGYSHPLEALIVFVGLAVAGAGKYSININKKKNFYKI